MLQKDIQSFSGSMDTDSDPRFVSPNDYRYALNAFNGVNKGKGGALVDAEGNILVDNPLLPTGTNKCIGSYEDIKGASIIYFNYNSQGYHGIWRYYINKIGTTYGVIEKVYQVKDPSAYNEDNPNPLSFTENEKITGVSLVDNNLYFTSTRQPKCVDIERANTTNKPLSFNIYLNKVNFITDTIYDINIYQEGNATPIYTISIASTTSTYADRAKDVFEALSLDPLFGALCRADYKQEYIAITMIAPGNFYIDLTDTAGGVTERVSRVVADNFYPDVITGTPYSYEALKEWHFISIRQTATCQPSAEYATGYEYSDIHRFYAGMTANNATFNFTIPALTPNYSKEYWLNIADNITSFYDPNGEITPDNITGIPLTLSSGVAPSSWTSALGPFWVVSRLQVQLQINLGYYTTSPLLPRPIPVGSYFEISANGVSQRFDLTVIVQPGTYNIYLENLLRNFSPTAGLTPKIKFFMATPISNPYVMNVNILGGYWEVTPVDGQKQETGIISSYKNYLFRTKYVYRGYKNSVYSAISQYALPLTRTEDVIEVDYEDIVLTDRSKVSELLEVVLSVSFDDNSTWYDFKTLKPYQFANQFTYQYNDDETLTPVASSDAILPYHTVPVKAVSQEYADNRIWYGDITEGYDKTPLNIVLENTYHDFTPDIYPNANTSQYLLSGKQGNFWKRGWTGYIGLVYYDDYDRKSAVCVQGDTPHKVKFYTESDFFTGAIENTGPATIGWSIYHEPPSWATKYQWVRTVNFQESSYLIWTANAFYQVGTDCTADFSNIGNNQYPTNFQYVVGDKIRPIGYWDTLTSTMTYYTTYAEFIIKSVGTGTDITFVNDVSYDWVVPIPANTTRYGIVFEIFSPRADASLDNATFYEFGECYEIGVADQYGIKRRYHKGSTQDQEFGAAPFDIITPATGTFGFKAGNGWYRKREMNFHIFSGQPLAASQPPIISEYEFEQSQIKASNNGRANLASLLGQIHYASAFRLSNQIIIGTQINGLSAFEPANIKVYNIIYGSLSKMQLMNNDVLKMLFSNSFMVEVYVNQGRLQQAQGAGALIVDDTEVAGNSHINQRSFGTQNPESVAYNDEGDLFYWDEKEGVVGRASGNATVPVSAYKMTTAFRDISIARLQLDLEKSNTCAVYDLYRDEYILTFNSLPAVPVIYPEASVLISNMAATITNIKIVVVPNNLIIYNGPFVSGGFAATDTRQFVVDKFNNYAHGWRGVYNDDEAATITAPAVAGYSQSQLNIVITYIDPDTLAILTKTYSYAFSKGQEAGQSGAFTGVTLAFNKNINGWVTYYSFVPECYGRLKNDFVSFMNGRVWLHGEGTYKNYYGVQYDRKLKIICNKDYPKNKRFLSLWVNGTNTNDVDIVINSYQGMQNGMHSLLKQANFETKEGIQAASLLRDDTTPGMTADEGRINGRLLIGGVMEAEFSNGDPTQSTINTINIIYNHSEQS